MLRISKPRKQNMQSTNTPLALLEPGQSIHFGHSFVIVNVAGVKIALDIPTTTGYCSAPFSNLVIGGKAVLPFLKPLVDPNILPSSSDLAEDLDAILYSHLHSDHFNLHVLYSILQRNPRVKVYWPVGSINALRYRPKNISQFWKLAVKLLRQNRLVKPYMQGIQEYVSSTLLPELPPTTCEMDNGVLATIKNGVKVRAFRVRHPQPQLYIPTPFDPPGQHPVLGYEVIFNASDGQEKSIFLIGESGTDPNLLWEIWSKRRQTIGVFIPVADESTAFGIKWVKDAYIHASLQIVGLIERLVTEEATIHCLHQGLWYYSIDEQRVDIGRSMVRNRQRSRPFGDIEDMFLQARKHYSFSIGGIVAQSSLLNTISRLPEPANELVKINLVGHPFMVGRKD